MVVDAHPLSKSTLPCDVEESNVFVPSLALTSIPNEHMMTRLKDAITKPNPKYALHVSHHDIPQDPQNVKVVLQHPRWCKAMLEELEAFHHNHTWKLVPRTSEMHVIGSMWVFKPKLKPYGSLDHVKARLMAKGYH